MASKRPSIFSNPSASQSFELRGQAERIEAPSEILALSLRWLRCATASVLRSALSAAAPRRWSPTSARATADARRERGFSGFQRVNRSQLEWAMSSTTVTSKEICGGRAGPISPTIPGASVRCRPLKLSEGVRISKARTKLRRGRGQRAMGNRPNYDKTMHGARRPGVVSKSNIY